MNASKEYISCADAAKYLRAALKHNFPAVKFSVRSKTYAGGASISVSWNNGPRSEDVDKVAGRFSGASFDGMIDLKSYHDSVLVDAQGNARKVHFGADYIFCRRELSPTLNAAVIAAFEATWSPDDWQKMPSYDRENMAYRAVCLIDIPNSEPESDTVKRALAAFFER